MSSYALLGSSMLSGELPWAAIHRYYEVSERCPNADRFSYPLQKIPKGPGDIRG